MVSKEIISKTFTEIIIKCGGSVKARELGSTAVVHESEGYKVIDYDNGIQITFRKSYNPNLFAETEDFVMMYLGGSDTRKYMGYESYSFFNYQKDWIIEHYGEDEWEFVSKYSDNFASSDGMQFNSNLRKGKMLDDDSFLRREHEHYLEIISNVPCDEGDCISLRVVDNLHDNDAINRRIVSDKSHTCTSVGMDMEAFSTFADVTDCWKIFTVIDEGSGAKGFFYGNSLKEIRGYDWEKELHFVPKQKFERFLIDEENKIIIQRPVVKNK